MVILVLSFATESDRDKFEYLYAKYKNLMFYKAWEILKDHMLAEDAVSEAYLRVYKNLHKIDDPASNRSISFIVTIVRNTALTLLKQARPGAVESYEEDQPDTFDLEQTVFAQVSEQRIYEILNGMDEVSRNVFLLKYAHDFSHKEIAAQLGMTENNITVKLHRVKKKLADMLVKEGYTHGG